MKCASRKALISSAQAQGTRRVALVLEQFNALSLGYGDCKARSSRNKVGRDNEEIGNGLLDLLGGFWKM